MGQFAGMKRLSKLWIAVSIAGICLLLGNPFLGRRLHAGQRLSPIRGAPFARTTSPSAYTQTGGKSSPFTTGAPRPTTLKIQITEDGLYQLTYDDLFAAGLDPSLYDPRTLTLQNRGLEIPIEIEGAQDGHFDPTDTILFYGKRNRDLYTVQNIYWLSIKGGVGKRWIEQDGRPGDEAATPPYFPTTDHFEEDTVYWQNRPGTHVDRWFWGHRLGPNAYGLDSTRTYHLALGELWEAGKATIRVSLQGYTGLGHHTRLYLNDQEIDDQVWRGQQAFIHQILLPASLLRNGENLLRIETVATASVVDQILVNWIEVDYQQRYRVIENKLRFRATAMVPSRFTLTGVTEPDLFVLDITNATAPIRFTHLTLRGQDGEFSVHFAADTDPSRRYFVTTRTNAKSPSSLELDQPSTWQSPVNAADYIIITGAPFYTSARRLAAHRQATGMRVATVKVEDLYDEFNDGRFSPVAIRAFLHYAFHHWQRPAPAYVVLLGDANQDYKDNLQSGTKNYVPSYTMESQLFGEISSDNWFVARSDEDHRPLMAIGRLSAQSVAEAETMVDKIIRYEQPQTNTAWQKVLLHVADQGTSFEYVANQLALQVPSDYTVEQIYAGSDAESRASNAHANVPNSRASASLATDATEIVDLINQGSALVTYVGHGHYASWGRSQNGYLFDVAAVAALHNSDKLPLIIAGNCLNGFFAGAQEMPALAEVLQRQRDGGAIAVWAPSGLSYPEDHLLLFRAFYTALFANTSPTIGEAITTAKRALSEGRPEGRELIDTYILFGDPALRLAGTLNAKLSSPTTIHAPERLTSHNNRMRKESTP